LIVVTIDSYAALAAAGSLYRVSHCPPDASRPFEKFRLRLPATLSPRVEERPQIGVLALPLVASQCRFGSALATSVPVSSIDVTSRLIGVGVAAGTDRVSVGVARPGVCVGPVLGVLEVPGVLEGPAVGVALGVSVGTGVVVVSPPAGFASLPQATSSSPIVAAPAVAARRACFHPRVDISVNLLCRCLRLMDASET
jgi:hypothetical protein